MKTGILLLLVAAVLFGCRAEYVPEEPAAEDPTAEPPRQADVEIQDTIWIEGMAEAVLLRRYDEPGVPFTTYYPVEHMAPGSFASAEGLHVRFAMGTGNGRRDAPFLGFFFPSDDMTVEELKALIRHQSQMEDWRITSDEGAEPPRKFDWVVYRTDYHVRPGDEWLFGTVLIARRGERVFSVRKQYPPEFGDGFLPRAGVVLEHFELRR